MTFFMVTLCNRNLKSAHYHSSRDSSPIHTHDLHFVRAQWLICVPSGMAFRSNAVYQHVILIPSLLTVVWHVFFFFVNHRLCVL
jgi:hypothetical protein